MIASRMLHIVLVSCLICANFTDGFILKKRHNSRDNNLEDALKYIEQEQQRLSDERMAIENAIETAYYSGLSDQDIEEALEESQAIPGEYNEMIDMPEPVDKEEEAQEYEPDMNEINDMLSSEDDENNEEEWYEGPPRDKKEVPFALGGVVPGEKRSADMPEENTDEETLSEDEVNALLEEADNTLENNLDDSNEEQSQEDTLEPVSDEELSSVLNDDDEDEENSEETTQNTSNGEYWPIYPASPKAEKKNIKKKRSPFTDAEEEYLEEADEADKITKAKDYIKTFLELEDDENTNLANALNLATLAQVEKDDSYVRNEVKYLKNAIADEQKIQSLKAELNVIDSDEEEDIIEDSVVELPNGNIFEESEEVEEIPLQRKRGDIEEPLFLDDEDDIDEDKLDENEEISMDDLENEMIERILREKLREYLLKSKVADAYKTPVIEEQDDESWSDNNYADSQDEYLNPLLRELWQQYGRDEKRSEAPLFDDVENEDIYDEDRDDEDISTEEVENAIQQYLNQYMTEDSKFNDEICPALDMIDDCNIARRYGLKLDDEALDLCNRHQICYTCGSVHDMTSSSCDEGYIAESSMLCGDDEECREDAMGLLDLMVLQGHLWHKSYETPPTCSAQCTMDYVYGLDKK